MRRSSYIVALSAGLISGVIGGCYLRPSPAPGFRFSCNATADCQALDCSGASIPLEKADTLIEGCDSLEVKADPTLGVRARQTCMSGLCEYPCNLQTFQLDCPSSEGFQFCFNGACANLCGTDDYTKYNYESNDDFCAQSQTCVPFDASGLDPMVLGTLGVGGGGGQGGFNVNTLPTGAGMCGTRCDAADALPCPAGQYCTGALCLPGCDEPTATPCDAGTTCIALAGFSSCLTSCTSGGDPQGSCAMGEVCVPGLQVCQPTCIGLDKVECPETFECDQELAICIPVGGDETTGGSSTT